MAEDDTDRADEQEAEHRAEIEQELERIDREDEDVDEGDDSLGKQRAPTRAEEASDEETIDQAQGDEDEE